MILILCNSLTVFASAYTAEDAYKSLISVCKTPWETDGLLYMAYVGSDSNQQYIINLQKKTYSVKNGGFYLYSEVVGTTTLKGTDIVDMNKFNQLTLGSKQEFLEDLFTVANGLVDAVEKGKLNNQRIAAGVTSETVGVLYTYLEGKEGMGSVLMASVMENTKPNFSSANRIWQPFSGLVGTILGLISVVIMALLGITMALDISYITVPAMRIALNAGGQAWHTVDLKSGQETNRFKISNLVSQAAKNAVLEENGGAGVHSKSRETNNHPLGVYFKYRWLELCVLGVCLLYLVSGNIYSFVAWILDLVSGFLGF